MARMVFLVVLMASVGGCLEGDDAPQPVGPTASQRGAASYPFVCDETTVETQPGVCAQAITAVDGQLSEPAFAQHPVDVDVMAVGAHLIGGPVAMPRLVHAALYVTEDGGATWTRSLVPLPGTPDTAFSDPSLVFTADGTLVYSGLAVSATTTGPDVFTVRSDDLGATWDTPQVVSDPGTSNDRQWLVGSDGVLYLSWQVPGDRSSLATSDDGGATWTRLGDIEGCITGGPVAMLDGSPYMACSRADDGSYRIEVHAVEAAALRHVATIEDMRCIAPRLLQTEGTWIATCYSALVSMSHDQGMSWSAPIQVAERTTVDDGRQAPQLYWSETDGHGNLHVLMAPFHRVPQQQANAPHHVYLATFTVDGLSLLQERRLTTTESERTTGDPGALPPSVGDDWYQMAFDHEGGRMVWMHGGAVYVGRVTAEPAV